MRTALQRIDPSTGAMAREGAPGLPIVATVTFVRREATAADPLVEMRLLRQKEFAYVNALNFLYGVASLCLGISIAANCTTQRCGPCLIF